MTTDKPDTKPPADDDRIVMPTITVRAVALGLFLSAFFTWFSIVFSRRLAATQIPVMPYLLLFVILLGINPLLRALKVRKLFSTAEVMTIFLMCFLSSFTAGFSGNFVYKMIHTSIGDWSNQGGNWEVYVEPFIKDHLVLAEEGRQAQAQKIRTIHLERQAIKQALDAAKQLKVQREQIGHVEAERRRIENDPDLSPKQRQIKERQYKQQKKFLEFAEERWKNVKPEDVSLEQVLNSYEETLEQLKTEEDALIEAYHESKDATYEEVRRFIKGLPEKERAIPGFVYLPGEGWAGYSSRLMRVHYGRQALKEIINAEALLSKQDPIPKETAIHLDAALAEMEKITDGEAAIKRKTSLEDVIKSTRTTLNDLEAELRDKRSERRFAPAKQIKELDELIEGLSEKSEEARKQLKELESELHQVVQPQVAAVQYAQAAHEELKRIRESIDRASPPAPQEVHDDLQRLRAEFVSFDASLRRFLISDINWRVWIKPIASWIMIFVVFYMIIMTLNTLVYRQWAYNEKLCYPLAHLPEIIVQGSGDPKQWVPNICKSGLFWTGVSISFGVLTWNYLANQKIISGVNAITLIVHVNEYVSGTIFEGLSKVRFFVIFSVIGVSFLLPTRITFSLWAFYLFYIFEGLFLVWIGYLTNIYQYRRGGFGANYGSAQACGAVLVFAIYTFYASRAYFLAAFRPNALSALSPDELKSTRLSSAVFIGSTLLMILLLVTMLGANPFYAALYTFVFLATAIVFSRMVAEGGILSTSTDFNIFLLMRYSMGMKHSWTLPTFLAPLYLLGAFIPIAISPMMANAIHLRDKMKLSRRWFYFGTFAAIILALVVGITTRIILVYNNSLGHGVGGGMKWVGLVIPKNLITGRYAEDNFGGTWWLLSGIVMMTFILWARKKWPWMIHPLGLLMISSSMIIGYWGSIILGWSFKVLVSKYGSRQTYERLRNLFIGLVIGELLSALFGFHIFSHGWNP